MKDHPNIVIMYLQIKMFLNYDDKYYRESLEYYKKNNRKFDEDLRKFYFLVMQHYLKIKLNARKGNHDENNILTFEFNDLIFLKSNYYLKYLGDGRTFDGYLFLDILKNAAYFGNISWMKSFYETYSKFITKEASKDCFYIYSSFICFHNKDFNKTINNTGKISDKSPEILHEGKLLYCLEAYEMKYYDSLISHLKNFNANIKDNSNLNSTTVRETAAFIRYFRKLIKISTSKDINFKTALRNLRKEIEEDEKVIPYKKIVFINYKLIVTNYELRITSYV